MTLNVVILAAGRGKRMHSREPKVLHCLAGKPLLTHVVITAHQFVHTPLVVVGHGGEEVMKQLSALQVRWVPQHTQLGTGHAVLQVLPMLDAERVLILYGDVPLISPALIQALISTTPHHSLGFISATLADPAGFGRVIRNADHHVIGIIEEKDADEVTRAIHEINTGIYLIPTDLLKRALPLVKNENAQGEYYLTDIIQFAVAAQVPIHAINAPIWQEVMGVNDCAQLALLERFFQEQQVNSLMSQGVTFADPKRFDLRGELQVGIDVFMDVNVLIEGHVIIGDAVHIGPNTLLRDCVIGDRVRIKANTVLEGAHIASDCQIGPFSRIRPQTTLAAHVHIGNFVEVKQSHIGEYTKINHLSYMGDAQVGREVNVGAGTITCNYDGAHKHQTVIGDGVFIGSDCQLIAPVVIGDGATIGAGSTITQDAPPNQLTLSRAKQTTVTHWHKPKKEDE